MERLIHIHAKCKSFEFLEQLPESVSEQRLIDIRDGFMQVAKKERFKNEKLSVRTRVVNPELPFKN